MQKKILKKKKRFEYSTSLIESNLEHNIDNIVVEKSFPKKELSPGRKKKRIEYFLVESYLQNNICKIVKKFKKKIPLEKEKIRILDFLIESGLERNIRNIIVKKSL